MRLKSVKLLWNLKNVFFAFFDPDIQANAEKIILCIWKKAPKKCIKEMYQEKWVKKKREQIFFTKILSQKNSILFSWFTELVALMNLWFNQHLQSTLGNSLKFQLWQNLLKSNKKSEQEAGKWYVTRKANQT